MILIDTLKDVVALSALLHDIGKSNKAFQNRLKKGLRGGDYYRHEYLSLKIFLIMIDGCKTDIEWLDRFSGDDLKAVSTKSHVAKLIDSQIEDGSFDTISLADIPPLARLVAWLVVTHHRLPPSLQANIDNNSKMLSKLGRHFDINISKGVELGIWDNDFNAYSGWQKNLKVKEENSKRALSSTKFDVLITESVSWRTAVNKRCQKISSNKALFADVDIQNPLTLHLSRLLLVLSDHNYSSFGDNELNRRLEGDKAFSGVYANSNDDLSVRQPLDEHLIGVSSSVDELISSFSESMSNLPALNNTNTLPAYSDVDAFSWHNKAYDTACQLQDISTTNGLFCINLASTGCGKTTANARIIKGVSKGETRFTVALGLKALTLQTATLFEDKLSLNKGDLAVVVGNETNSVDFYHTKDEDAHKGVVGSESIDLGFNENLYSDIDPSLYRGLDTLLSDDKSQKMLLSPVLICTIDHIIQASEGLHGGKNIAPALRLMSSDLILDGPDSFRDEDLPAISRLVFVAGMYGSRIVLSSATLTPTMISFLFDAYMNGRKLFNTANKISGEKASRVPCMLVDEHDVVVRYCDSKEDAYRAFNDFSRKHCDYLSTLPVRRKAEIIDMDTLSYDREFPEFFFSSLSQLIINQACKLHDRYHEVDVSTGKSISVGLVRMAHSKSVVALAKEFVADIEVDEDTCIHFCCYHSHQLLALRNELESSLSSVLDRSDNNTLLVDKPAIYSAINDSAYSKHVFIVLATPIAEVGHNHDYDWAILEPSSMRSIVQLGGRVWRHRPNKVALEANIAIMQYNLSHFIGDKKIPLATYDFKKLIPDSILNKIDSTSCNLEDDATSPPSSLAQLEHDSLRRILDLNQCCLANSVWHPTSKMYNVFTDVYLLTRFRGVNGDDSVDLEYVVSKTPHDKLGFYIKKDLISKGLEDASCRNHIINKESFESLNPNVRLWLDNDIFGLAENIAKKEGCNLDEILLKYFVVQLKDTTYKYNDFLGFYHQFS